jgi:transposase
LTPSETTLNRYTPEFRNDAIQLVARGERPVTQIAASLGVNYWTLRGWYKDAMAGKKKPSQPRTQTLEEQLAALEKENKRLLRENASLKEDREILKKATAFFAKERG